MNIYIHIYTHTHTLIYYIYPFFPPVFCHSSLESVNFESYYLGKWISFSIYRKESESESHSGCSESLRPGGLYSPWNSPGLELVAFPFFSGTEKQFKCNQIVAKGNVFNYHESESEVAQSCPTLCDPMDCSLPVSSVLGIFQARVLEWIAISFSRESSQPRDQTWVSHIVGTRFTVWATREVKS